MWPGKRVYYVAEEWTTKTTKYVFVKLQNMFFVIKTF